MRLNVIQVTMLSHVYSHTCGTMFVFLCFFIFVKCYPVQTNIQNNWQNNGLIDDNQTQEHMNDSFDRQLENNGSTSNDTSLEISEIEVQQTTRTAQINAEQVEKFQKELLRRLGIPQSDLKTSGAEREVIPSYIQSLYEQMAIHDDDIESRTNGITSSMSSNQMPTITVHKSILEDNNQFRFNISNIEEGANITKSQLVIDKDQAASIEKVTYTGTDEETEQAVDLRFMEAETAIVADITNIVLQENGFHLSNLSFRVDSLTTDTHVNPMIAVFQNVDMDHLASRRRKKRQSGGSNSQEFNTELNKYGTNVTRNEATIHTAESSGICRIARWEMRFSDIGWNDWLIAPRKYSPNLCVGVCPPLFIESYLNATNYAFVKNLYHVKTDFRHNENVPEACCSPLVYTSQSVMYLNREDEYIIKTLPEMRVLSCGCR